MNRKRAVFICILIAAIAALIWWLTRESIEGESQKSVTAQQDEVASITTSTGAVTVQSNIPPKSPEERMEETVEKIERVLATPITFSGKVVDQNGNQVANATIKYSLLDKFNASGSNGETIADDKGVFMIDGVNGAVLGVNVSKDGYYQIHNVSNQRFAYGVGPDGYTKPPPTKDEPAVFVLQKKGEPVPLIRVSSRQIDLPRNGGSLTIDLASGRKGQGDLQLSSQLGNTSQQPFNWLYQLNMSGGGLVEREGQFAFEAPTEGYKSSVIVKMDVNAERWTSDVLKEYFARLPDGRYARFSINFYPGERNFVVLESYVNPEPGDRNLEFDAKKAARSP